MKKVIWLLIAAPLGYLAAVLMDLVAPTALAPSVSLLAILMLIGLPAALMQVKFGPQTVSNRLSQENVSQAKPHGGPVQLKIPEA